MAAFHPPAKLPVALLFPAPPLSPTALLGWGVAGVDSAVGRWLRCCAVTAQPLLPVPLLAPAGDRLSTAAVARCGAVAAFAAQYAVGMALVEGGRTGRLLAWRGSARQEWLAGTEVGLFWQFGDKVPCWQFPFTRRAWHTIECLSLVLSVLPCLCLTPSLVSGKGVGQLVARCIEGTAALEDCLLLLAEYSRLLAHQPRGLGVARLGLSLAVFMGR